MMSPSDLLATPILNAFQNVALAIIIERQNKLHFSDQCQTKFLLPKSQNEFYDLLTIPSCTSSTTINAKGMENGLIFHVTIQIQILTMFSVQSKYSKKTKSISLLGFVISNKTCKTWNVQIRCQPSRLSSSSRWKPNSLLPMQKRPMDSSHGCRKFSQQGGRRCWKRWWQIEISEVEKASWVLWPQWGGWLVEFYHQLGCGNHIYGRCVERIHRQTWDLD